MAEKEEEKYEVLEKIGQGSFGIIRKVRQKTTQQILCRKEISYSRMSDKEKNQLHAELRILESLRHPNIVQYCHREHLKTSHDLHLYMEYCGNGDLGGYVKKLKDRGAWAEEEFVWQVMSQLVSALYRCHYGEDPPPVGQEGGVRMGRDVSGALKSKEGHRMILHRDLKPENVFLGENNSVKLGDFGLSKIIASHDFASTYVGTPFYMSPEICAAERYSHHSDIWSLGCIIYELASRTVPFDARNHVELIMKIKAGKIKPLPPQYSRELGEVIAWCLKVDPRNRPDTAQLLNVPRVKLAREMQAHHEQNKDVQTERDIALTKLAQAQKQIVELQQEVKSLREQGKKVEMEWHARATLAIDQRVYEQVEAKKSELLRQFETAVDQRAEQKLSLHLASLPTSHGLNGGDSTHVRSSTPPPGKVASSFATTGTTATTQDTDFSSVRSANIDDSALETDLTSLSLQDQEQDEVPIDDVSPLASRNKPLKKAPRRGFVRAKTYANDNLLNAAALPSPVDVAMADPSPMPPHVAPMSVKGLGLSPRKTDRLSGGVNLRRNIFNKGNGADQHLRPHVPGDSQGAESDAIFADDDDSELIDEDADAALEESPSRPSSGLSNHNGDPFKVLNAQPTKQRILPRPSLTRQKTMPVNTHPRAPAQRANIFAARGVKSPEREKENRPPSSHGRNTSGLPTISAASPKRPIMKDAKALTPSRKAPLPPTQKPGVTINNLAKVAHKNNLATQTLSSPDKGGLQGRTLVQLQQARSQPVFPAPMTDSEWESEDASETQMMLGGPRLLPSPAKWDPMSLEFGEEMPSPFLARKGRVGVR